MSPMYIESNNNKAYSLEYVACADEDKDKALKNPKHLFKIFSCVESVTTSQGSMDGQNNGEKLFSNDLDLERVQYPIPLTYYLLF